MNAAVSRAAGRKYLRNPYFVSEEKAPGTSPMSHCKKENRIMILAIDIGNTTVALGGIRDGRVCFVARMDTVRTRTAAEYRAEMDKIFAHRRHPERPMSFEGAVLTSVVPQITGALAECARHYTGKKPVIVSPDIRTGLTMGVDEPGSVGKDRLVDAAYAAANFPLPVVTVDLGTATTFNVVDEDRVFRGGVICPGLSTGLRALGERCAQLPQVHLGSPKSASGTNTEKCMLSGSVMGTAVLIDGMVQRIEEELGRPATLVVTGGLAKYVTPLCRHPLTYDPELLMKGLALLYQLNAQQPQHHSAGGRHYGPQNQHGRARQRYPRKRTRCERADEARTG